MEKEDVLFLFVYKNKRERLKFEFNKDRQSAIFNLAIEKYFDPSNLCADLTKKTDDQIIEFFKGKGIKTKNVYIISCGKFDGQIVNLTHEVIWDVIEWSPSVVVLDEKNIFVVGEQEIGASPKLVFSKK